MMDLSPPGDTVQAFIDDRGDVSLPSLADELGLKVSHLRKLIKGKIVLTPELAERLSDVFGLSIEFWLAREERYRKALEQNRQVELDMKEAQAKIEAMKVSALRAKRDGLVRVHTSLKKSCSKHWATQSVLLRGSHEQILRRSAKAIRAANLACAFMEGRAYRMVEPRARGRISNALAEEVVGCLESVGFSSKRWKVQAWADAGLVSWDKSADFIQAKISAEKAGAGVLPKHLLDRLVTRNMGLEVEVQEQAGQIANLREQRSGLHVKSKALESKLKLATEYLQYQSDECKCLSGFWVVTSSIDHRPYALTLGQGNSGAALELHKLGQVKYFSWERLMDENLGVMSDEHLAELQARAVLPGGRAQKYQAEKVVKFHMSDDGDRIEAEGD